MACISEEDLSAYPFKKRINRKITATKYGAPVRDKSI